MVTINNLFNRVQDLIANLPYYEQIATFVALLVVFLAIFKVGSQKMAQSLNWGNESGNAVTGISITFALAATISSYIFLNSRGVYITHPILGKIFLMLLVGFGIYNIIHIFRADEEMGEIGRFLIAVGVIAAYHGIGWLFFSDFPDNLGENLALIIELIYWAAIVFIGWSAIRFLGEHFRRD